MAKKQIKEPSKNEIMFFRVGVILITLTLVVASIIMLVSYFMKKEKDQLPFEDEFNITLDDLANLMYYDEASGLYVIEFEYFKKYDNYDELRPLLLNNNIIYIYLYKPENVNEETEKLINNTDLEKQAFFFLNIDKYDLIFEDPRFTHIDELVESKNEMLLIYNVEEQSFEVLLNHSVIVDEIKDLG